MTWLARGSETYLLVRIHTHLHKRGAIVSKFLIRIEGLNLSSFVLDSSDLSTIRGAGLLLLDAVKKVPNLLSSKPTLSPISIGASVGLYELEFENDSDFDENNLSSTIANVLDQHPMYRHATFGVSIQQIRSKYKETEEQTVAQVRWAQMQSPTVLCRENADNWWDSVASVINEKLPNEPTAPIDGDQKRTRLACGIDHLRPATTWPANSRTKPIRVSGSTAVRKSYGQIQKKHFYRQLFDEHGDNASSYPTKFATEFSELGQTPKELGDHTDIVRLDRKMAVLYFDGNKFGDLLRKKTTDAESHREIDRQMRGSRSKFMIDFLTRFQNPTSLGSHFWHTKEQHFQLETLLWGGDEIIWVVPAWQGWNLAMQFFCDWNQGDGPLKNEKMTHAAGIVFCNVKTPIHRVTALTRDLAEACKTRDRTTNLLAYEVLESFDHTGPDLADHRNQRTPVKPSAATTQPLASRAPRNLNVPIRTNPITNPNDVIKQDPDRLAISLQQMSAVDQVCQHLKSIPDFRRGRLRNLATQSLANGADHTTLNRACDTLLSEWPIRQRPDSVKAISAAVAAFESDHVLLCNHLNEVWDYVGLSIHRDFELGAKK